MDNAVNLLNIVLVVLVFIIMFLGLLYFFVWYRNKNKTKEEIKATEKGKNSSEYVSPIDGRLTKDSIYKFMEFDEIKDNMIIRKNRTQYVMVIQCQGVNYDLLSEAEKVAVEEGFVQFLNTLRFQVQLYVQTRSLNLRDIIEEYNKKVGTIQKEVEQLRAKIQIAANSGNTAQFDRLKFEERRKINILEYGRDISEYIGRMSLNRNVLQQKTYIVVSYFVSELGGVANYSKEEIDNMCFSELYTRAQAIIRSLASCEVSGRILNSEELAELLYIAYNRDDAELLQLSKALDAEYDALYSTSKDVLEKREKLLDKKLEEEAVELATKSIISADEKLEKEKEEKAKHDKKLRQKATRIVNEYKSQMEPELYNKTLEEIKNETSETKEDEELEEIDEEVEEASTPKKRKGRPKKAE